MVFFFLKLKRGRRKGREGEEGERRRKGERGGREGNRRAPCCPPEIFVQVTLEQMMAEEAPSLALESDLLGVDSFLAMW